MAPRDINRVHGVFLIFLIWYDQDDDGLSLARFHRVPRRQGQITHMHHAALFRRTKFQFSTQISHAFQIKSSPTLLMFTEFVYLFSNDDHRWCQFDIYDKLPIDAEADWFALNFVVKRRKRRRNIFHRLIELSGGISEITNFNVIFVKLHVVHYFIAP